MQDFRQLKVWRKAHELTLEVYRKSRRFPPEERFGLTAELRRSARSIGSNIAEGCAKDTDAEFRRFVVIAFGSASELEYQLLLAGDLEYLSPTDQAALNSSCTEVERMLNSLSQTLKTKGQLLTANS